jgi:hypothetical protein
VSRALKAFCSCSSCDLRDARPAAWQQVEATTTARERARRRRSASVRALCAVQRRVPERGLERRDLPLDRRRRVGERRLERDKL